MSEDISQDTSASVDKPEAPRTGGRGGGIVVIAVVVALVLLLAFNMN